MHRTFCSKAVAMRYTAALILACVLQFSCVLRALKLLYLFPYRTEKDRAPPSPFLTINNKGEVEVQNDQVLVSTCRMHIYKFPFDIQSCNLSFKSVTHTGENIFIMLPTELQSVVLRQFTGLYKSEIKIATVTGYLNKLWL